MQKNKNNLTKLSTSELEELPMREILQFPQFPDAMPNPVVITNTKGRILYVNPAWEKLTGYTLSEVKGEDLRLLKSDKTPKPVFSALWKALKKGDLFDTDKMVNKRKDGTEYSVYSIFFPIKQHGNILCYAQIQRDISVQKAIEEELRLYETILNTMAEGVSITQAENEKILYTNPKFNTMFGYKEGELIGKPGRMFTYMKDQSKIKAKTENIIKQLDTDHEAKYEVLNVKKDGSPFWCRAIASQFVHPKYGKLWVIVRTDISEEKKLLEALERKEDQLHKLIEEASDGIFISDLQGKYIDVNSAGSKLLGYTKKEFLGMKITDLIPAKDIPRLWEEQKKQLIGKTHVGEWKMIRKDKTLVDVEVSASVLPDGRWLGFVRDISDRKILEQQKNTFIATASHELKSPITTLKSYAQLLEKRLKESGSEQEKQLIQRIISQTDQLTELVNDLLHVNSIESEKLHIDKKIFSLQKLIKKVVGDIQVTTTSHHIMLKGKGANKVVGDETRTQQILNNLITNAVKYSPQSKEVIVILSSNQTHAVVAVQDFGFGISKEDQKHIFERFFRTHEKAAEKIEGFGLGLYISLQLAKRQGGHLWVESQKGKGSTFFLSLPLQQTT